MLSAMYVQLRQHSEPVNDQEARDSHGLTRDQKLYEAHHDARCISINGYIIMISEEKLWYLRLQELFERRTEVQWSKSVTMHTMLSAVHGMHLKSRNYRIESWPIVDWISAKHIEKHVLEIFNFQENQAQFNISNVFLAARITASARPSIHEATLFRHQKSCTGLFHIVTYHLDSMA